jgi:hypothetical protein
MARSRNIKPGFFKNENLADCTPLARLLFAGLWCLADRAGRLEDRPKRIRAELLPYDDGSVDDLLSELDRAGFIRRYEAYAQRFIQITNFAKHQTPHHKEPASLIPAPDLSGTCLGHDQDQPKSSRADSLNLIPDSLNPITATSPAGDQMSCPAERIVEAYHVAMPTNPRCKVLNAARRGMIRARWNEAAKLTCKPFGYSTVEDGVAAWTVFFETCAQSEFLTGRAAPQPGKPPFLADIDFLMSPSGFAKCLENKYHREAA